MYIARGSLHFYILPSGSYIFIYCQAVRTFLYIARRFVHFYIMPSGPYILNIAAGCVYFLYYQGVYILLYKHLDLHCVPFRWVSWAEKKMTWNQKLFKRSIICKYQNLVPTHSHRFSSYFVFWYPFVNKDTIHM